jgi:hypothetical protein
MWASVTLTQSEIESELPDDTTLVQLQSSPVSPHLALWRAVILQAIIDARTHSLAPEAVAAKHSAINWLRLGNQSFRAVCDLADCSPHQVMASIHTPKTIASQDGTSALESHEGHG